VLMIQIPPRLRLRAIAISSLVRLRKKSQG
jgi:hypothetical protein